MKYASVALWSGADVGNCAGQLNVVAGQLNVVAGQLDVAEVAVLTAAVAAVWLAFGLPACSIWVGNMVTNAFHAAGGCEPIPTPPPGWGIHKWAAPCGWAGI